MPEVRTTRRLAAILAADVVGYSRMMAGDEAGTLAALKRHREAIFDPAVAANSGRIVKLIGDGTLVEFGSVVDAVNCALAVQRMIAAEGATSAKITLRIGVNLGDIIIDGDDIYGDGVNVAARLEPLAEPGGVCVSAIVNESVGSRVEVSFVDGGEVQVKNIDRPIRVWKWHPGKGLPMASVPKPATEIAKPGKPAIAVLPFNNMSGDPEQEYFSDGITEDIITDLSKVAGLMVIARNSSFTYKGKSVDIRTVGRELGVTVVLEGSIRRAGNRVRITAQLIDAGTGGHVWADRYDRDLTDIFAVQDEVTREIVGALKISLTPSETARISEGGTTNVEAHDLLLRGRELAMAPTKNRDVFERSVAIFTKAIDLDPDYADAYAALAATYNLDFHNRWTDDPDGSRDKSVRYAELAVKKGPNEPFPHYVAALVAVFRGDLDRALAEANTALALNPNYALALSARGNITNFLGEPEAAIPLIEQAIRLDPGFAHQYMHFLGMAYMALGKYETAAAVFKERIVLAPETDLTRAFYASALGHLGRLEEAREVWRDLKRINPKYSFAGHIGRLPFRKKADVERIAAGLTKAGLPD
jgi:adenylate cyclase